MMNQRDIEFLEKIIEKSVNVITRAEFVGGSFLRGLKPLTIFFEDDLVQVDNMTMHQLQLIVEVSAPFPYKENKMVPWNYNCNYVSETDTNNILGVGSMT